MRVLVAAGEWFPDYVGGTARVVRATAEALAKRGHQVTVIVPQARDEPEVSSVNGVQLRRVIRRSHLPLTITDVYEMRRAIRATSSGDFDLVLAHGATCTMAAMLAQSHKPIAFVQHASGVREARQRRSLGLAPLERWRSYAVEPFLYAFERLALRRATRILVLSAFSRRLVLEVDPCVESRIQIVGGGVDITDFTPAHDREALRQAVGIAADETVLMTARRLVSRMGVEILLDAFDDLHKRQANIKLVVAGDGELRSQLESQRNRLGLAGKVKFAGRVSDQELRSWYRVADLFVLPTIAYEGFGMVTAEALACGTPVVATPVGATSEILTPLDGRLVADSVDARSLAAAIERALALTDMMFRARCREYARRHLPWDIVISKWESALEGL